MQLSDTLDVVKLLDTALIEAVESEYSRLEFQNSFFDGRSKSLTHSRYHYLNLGDFL